MQRLNNGIGEILLIGLDDTNLGSDILDNLILPVEVKYFSSAIETYLYLEKHDVSIVVVNQTLEDMNGIDFLFFVKNKYEHIHRILVLNEHTKEDLLNAVNLSHAHYITYRPINNGELIDNINNNIHAIRDAAHRFEEQSKIKVKSEIERMKRLESDNFMEMLFSISETSNIQEFVSRLVSMLEGYFALLKINSQMYFETRFIERYEQVMSNLSDLEVISNQFAQKMVLIFIFTVKSYFYILTENLESSYSFYLGLKSLLDSSMNIEINDEVRELIELHPFNRGNKNLVINHQLLLFVELQLKKLLSTDLANMIKLPEDMTEYYDTLESNIVYFLILKNDLPIFERHQKDTEVSSNLISAFISAMSQFFMDVLKDETEIRSIEHEKGIIHITITQEIKYVALLTKNNAINRIFLKEVSEKISPIIHEIPPNCLASKEEKIAIGEILNKYFAI